MVSISVAKIRKSLEYPHFSAKNLTQILIYAKVCVGFGKIYG